MNKELEARVKDLEANHNAVQQTLVAQSKQLKALEARQEDFESKTLEELKTLRRRIRLFEINRGPAQ